MVWEYSNLRKEQRPAICSRTILAVYSVPVEGPIKLWSSVYPFSKLNCAMPYRKWFPPIKLSRQVPTSEFPKSSRSSIYEIFWISHWNSRMPFKNVTVWLTEPLPSPRSADWGAPRWIPRHSVELKEQWFSWSASIGMISGTRTIQ